MLINGEWIRIVTAMFVHVGILHLATNMWCLWNLGLLAEPLMGSAGVIAVYVLTGASGNLLSTLSNWYFYLRISDGFGPVGAGCVRRGVWDCGCVDCVAEVRHGCRCRCLS